MSPEEFKRRTFDYGIRVVRLVQALPKSDASRELGRQLLRAGTPVGANYRAASRARSQPDFIAKLGIVEEECDETLYWIEVLIELGFVKAKRVAPLAKEGAEILSMIVASINTARRALPRPIKSNQSTRNPQSATRISQ
jgi:four helix bundle protein